MAVLSIGVGPAGTSVAAVGSAGPGAATVSTTPEPTDAAPGTTAAPAPPVTTPVDPDDDGSDTDWALIIVAIVAGVAVIIALIAAFSASSRRRRPPPPPRQASGSAPHQQPQQQQSTQVALLSTAQWVHDQLSLELMAADPRQALARWAVERSRLDNVAIGAQQQYAAGQGDPWQSLSQMMTLLASSLDTNLNVRAQDQPDARLIAESTEVVTRHRATLQQLLAAMWPLTRR